MLYTPVQVETGKGILAPKKSGRGVSLKISGFAKETSLEDFSARGQLDSRYDFTKECTKTLCKKDQE